MKHVPGMGPNMQCLQAELWVAARSNYVRKRGFPKCIEAQASNLGSLRARPVGLDF